MILGSRLPALSFIIYFIAEIKDKSTRRHLRCGITIVDKGDKIIPGIRDGLVSGLAPFYHYKKLPVSGRYKFLTLIRGWDYHHLLYWL